MPPPQPSLAVAVPTSGAVPDARSAAQIEARKSQARELASMMNQSVDLCECVEVSPLIDSLRWMTRFSYCSLQH